MSFLSVSLAVTLLVPVKALANSCQNLFNEFPIERPSQNVYDYYLNEIAGKTDAEIKQMNKKMIEAMNAYVPNEQSHRAQSILWSDAENLIHAVVNHRVIGMKNSKKYDRDGTEVGYCFGRAMYVHLALLKMGLQKESIQKIWAVGPMESTSSFGVTWDYHVATIAFSKYDGWIVIDPNENRPQTLENWVRYFSSRSKDKKIRFYITEAQKQSLFLGTYSLLQLGLTLNVQDDWFKHYFVDMLAEFRIETLESLGLRKIDVASSYIDPLQPYVPVKPPETFFEQLKDFFWF